MQIDGSDIRFVVCQIAAYHPRSHTNGHQMGTWISGIVSVVTRGITATS